MVAVKGTCPQVDFPSHRPSGGRVATLRKGVLCGSEIIGVVFAHLTEGIHAHQMAQVSVGQVRRGLLHILPFLQQGGGADCFRSQALVHVLLTLAQHLSERGCAHRGESLTFCLQRGNGVGGIAEQFVNQLLGIGCHYAVTALFGRIRIGHHPLAVAVLVQTVEPELGGRNHGGQCIFQEVVIHRIFKVFPDVVHQPGVCLLVVMCPPSHTAEDVVLGEGGPLCTVGRSTSHGCAITGLGIAYLIAGI